MFYGFLSGAVCPFWTLCQKSKPTKQPTIHCCPTSDRGSVKPNTLQVPSSVLDRSRRPNRFKFSVVFTNS